MTGLRGFFRSVGIRFVMCVLLWPRNRQVRSSASALTAAKHKIFNLTTFSQQTKKWWKFSHNSGGPRVKLRARGSSRICQRAFPMLSTALTSTRWTVSTSEALVPCLWEEPKASSRCLRFRWLSQGLGKFFAISIKTRRLNISANSATQSCVQSACFQTIMATNLPNSTTWPTSLSKTSTT